MGFDVGTEFDTVTIARMRATLHSDNPAYLSEHELVTEGLRKAGVPEE
jgi:hypothetical protein